MRTTMLSFAIFLFFFPNLAEAQEVIVEETIECYGSAEDCAVAIETYINANPNGGVGVQDAINVGGVSSGLTLGTLDDPLPRLDPPMPTPNRTLEGAFGLSLNTGGAAVGSDGLFLLTPGIWGEIDGNGQWSFQLHGGVGFARAFDRNWYAPTTWIGANRRWESDSFAIGGRLQYVRSVESDSVVIGAFEPRFRHRFSESFGIGAYLQMGLALVNVEMTERTPGTAVDVYGATLERYQGRDDVTTVTISNELRPHFGGGAELFVEF